MKACMLLGRLGRQNVAPKSSQPCELATMMSHNMHVPFPSWNDLTSARKQGLRCMSVTNTKGPASGWVEKPEDGSDCPEIDKGGWGKRPAWKIEVEETVISAKETASKDSGRSSQQKYTSSKAPTSHVTRDSQSKQEAGTDSLRKQKAVADSQRAMYQEKQSNYRVDFTKVKSAPGPSKEHWWYPDPYTGFYVPENHFGEISKGVVERKANPGAKSKKQGGDSFKIVIQGKQKKGGDKGEKGWWISMEDLPDSLS